MTRDDMTPTEAEREKAREIVGDDVPAQTNLEWLDGLVERAAHAFAAARAQALEEAAQWHDKQARYFDDHPNAECAGVFAMEHRHSAAALRNLKQPQEPGNG